MEERRRQKALPSLFCVTPVGNANMAASAADVFNVVDDGNALPFASVNSSSILFNCWAVMLVKYGEFSKINETLPSRAMTRGIFANNEELIIL